MEEEILKLRILVRPARVICVRGERSSAARFRVHAESREFGELISKDAKTEVLITGLGFTEGPIWDPHGFLCASDEELNKIFRIYPDGRKEELVSLGDPDGNPTTHIGEFMTVQACYARSSAFTTTERVRGAGGQMKSDSTVRTTWSWVRTARSISRSDVGSAKDKSRNWNFRVSSEWTLQEALRC